MMDVRLLKSEMVKKGFNQGTLCRAISMSEATFSRRLKSGVFKTDEAMKMISVLGLKEPEKIFFAN